jgi:predicted porin
MKKTLLAAALTLGFAGVAQAETSVTLYGIIDTGIGYQKVEGQNGVDAKKTGLVNGVQSGSRFGLKGSEDLGNGLRAVFVLESGFNSSNGFSGQGGRLFGRQATVGLAGDAWGQLDLGRQTNIASKYFAGVANPFGDAFGQAGVTTTFGAASTARWDNMVMYQTPSFSGFQFGVGYSFNTGTTNSGDDNSTGTNDTNWDVDGAAENNNKGITTGLRYSNGPIGAAVTYDQIKNDSIVGAGTSNKIKAWNLGLSYDFEVVKLHAGFGQTRDGWMDSDGYGGGAAAVNPGTGRGVTGANVGGNIFIEGLDANLYTVGLSAPLGNGSLMAAFNMADFDDTNGRDFEKQHVYSLGYTYSLSKRTNVYAVGSYAKDLYGVDDTKSIFAGVGVRHQF